MVEIRVGPALETPAGAGARGAGPYDLVFIDADKENTPAYFAWSLERTRPGRLIIADNVIRDGALAHGTPATRRSTPSAASTRYSRAEPRRRADPPSRPSASRATMAS